MHFPIQSCSHCHAGRVPVGYEVAKALNAPLDVLLVRKLKLAAEADDVVCLSAPEEFRTVGLHMDFT